MNGRIQENTKWGLSVGVTGLERLLFAERFLFAEPATSSV